MFLLVCISTMAPKSSKKIRKTSSNKQSTISKYKKKVEAKIDKFNIITLIRTNGQGEYILVPSRKSPEGMRAFPYALAEEQLLFQKEINLNFQFPKNWPIMTWLTIRKTYIQWLDQVQIAKKEDWKRLGIFYLIQMSSSKIPMNASLLATTTCFWSSSLNVYVFKSGLKKITLYDLAILFSLTFYSMEIDPAFLIDTTTFDFVIIKSTDYDLFIKSYFNRKDEVSQAEHLAFLLIWLSNFISYNQSKKVLKVILGQRL